MPAGNSTTAASVGSAAISFTSFGSNSPLQRVPCSPFIMRGRGTIPWQQSPAAMVPNVRQMSETQTPDIGLRHLVPKTPTPHSDSEVPQAPRNWSMPMKVPEPTSGEQLVPQTPCSSATYTTPSRPRHHIESTTDAADTPRRSIQRRKPRQLPDCLTSQESPQHLQTTAQIDLFSGNDIFG